MESVQAWLLPSFIKSFQISESKLKQPKSYIENVINVGIFFSDQIRQRHPGAGGVCADSALEAELSHAWLTYPSTLVDPGSLEA